MDKKVALHQATAKANLVIRKYFHNIKNPANFRCESFIMNIIFSEGLTIDSYSFKNNDICGMLIVDEYEKTIVYNQNHSQPRRNFTLAHELGHYFLHSETRSEFADRSKDMTDEADSIIEMQANAFGSQIIIPKPILFHMLKLRYSFFKISKITRVSYVALYWILVNHLVSELKIAQQDAVLIVEDFRDFSIGSKNKLIHHNFSLIYRLNMKNYERVIKDYKDGKKAFEFKRSINGKIVGVDQLVRDPFAFYQ